MSTPNGLNAAYCPWQRISKRCCSGSVMMYSNWPVHHWLCVRSYLTSLWQNSNSESARSTPRFAPSGRLYTTNGLELLSFAGVLDHKLTEIALCFELPLQRVRDVCLLYRKQPTSNAYWERWNQLHHESGKFYLLMEAVGDALKQTPRASSLVENLNSRLRNYFFAASATRSPVPGVVKVFP